MYLIKAPECMPGGEALSHKNSLSIYRLETECQKPVRDRSDPSIGAHRTLQRGLWWLQTHTKDSLEHIGPAREGSLGAGEL